MSLIWNAFYQSEVLSEPARRWHSATGPVGGGLASLLDEDDLSGGESDGTFVSLLKDKIDHKYFAEDVLGFASS